MLIENFRTGVLDRLGFSVERLHELNPRLVVLSITGFGHDGPEGGRPGYDQIAQGEAGLMALTGPSPDEPYRVGRLDRRPAGGIHGAYGVVAALYERERTGQGKVVRTSLLAAVVGVHSYHGTAVDGRRPGARGQRQPPRLDRTLRRVPLRRRHDPDRRRRTTASGERSPRCSDIDPDIGRNMRQIGKDSLIGMS